MKRVAWFALMTALCTLLVGSHGYAQDDEPSKDDESSKDDSAKEAEPEAGASDADAEGAAPASSNWFTEDNFTNEFVGVQIVLGSGFVTLGTILLAYSVVRANDSEEILEPVGGVEQCDVGAVDPALCAEYRKIDEEADRLVAVGGVVVMTGVLFFTAAIVAWATATRLEEEPSKVSIAPLAGPGVYGVSLGATF
jgi:hypothetical protein